MNDNYENNIAVLQQRLPIPANEIEKAQFPDSRRYMQGPKGGLVFQYLENSMWKNLTSPYNPEREALLQTQHAVVEDAKLVFVLGEGGLYHLDVVLRRASSDAKVMLISNRPDYLKLALASRDLEEILSDERLVIVASNQLEMLTAGVRGAVFSDLYDVPTFSLVVHPLENVIQSSFVYEFQTILHWLFTSSMTNRSTTQFFEHWWSHNFITNLPFLLSAHKLGELERSWSKRPAIIVGAGPSLTKNLDTLRALQGRALILCVDTAYRVLAQAGIRPDLVVTLDGSPMNAEHMAGCDYSKVPLLFDEYSHRDITWGHQGGKIVLSNGAFHKHWWTQIIESEWEPSILETGGSVATTAFSFARAIDADPVILVGVDLSYPDGACYAAGALHEDRNIEELKKTRKLYEVKDIHGNNVYTTYDYLYYLKWFHRHAKTPDRTYINATEGGAVREGFLIETLADCAKQHCSEVLPTEEWSALLHRKEADPELMCKVLRNLKRSRRELKAAAKYLHVMSGEMAESLQRKAEEKELGTSGLYSHRLLKAKQHLGVLKLALAFLDTHSFGTIYKDVKYSELRERRNDEKTAEDRALESGVQAYELFAELGAIADQSLVMHDEGIKRLTSVIQEEAN